ncbi:uncharacterized protein LOC143192029 [Rhynchophorus ferrugineus]|uniref:Uncharacterized protein n=1 Tax=Rhynchophorus ferrugineus TaxID=354439 RepID=A0A834HVG5_RHYFE|nr:hypothetical protein GWI33_017463 [Rhynchophorus ferrugineus]
MFKYSKGVFAVFLVVNAIVLCSAGEEKTDVAEQKQSVEFVGRMLEQGRTLVHHALKRFMVILPAIFFKLGIGFTLLVLVTIVAINNGFIGFLLLVVGLSSVLARLQEARKQVAAAPVVSAPYVSAALPAYYPHAHAHPLRAWDRSDSTADKTVEGTLQYSPTYQYYTTPYGAYAQNRA